MFYLYTAHFNSNADYAYTKIEDAPPIQKPSCFQNVPDEICILIFKDLNIQSLISLNLVDRKFKEITDLDIFWKPHVNQLNLRISKKSNHSFKYLFATHCERLQYIAKKNDAVYVKKELKRKVSVDNLTLLSTSLESRDKLILWKKLATKTMEGYPIVNNNKNGLKNAKELGAWILNSYYITDMVENVSCYKSSLSSLPPEISLLNALTRLSLNHNYIEELPEEIGILQTLEMLDLSDNCLRRLPVQIQNLSNLKILNLSKNKLRSISKILPLTTLTTLHLSNNHFKQLPQSFNQFTNLRSLSISDNDSLELSLSDLPISNLKKLTISKNQLASESLETIKKSKTKLIYL